MEGSAEVTVIRYFHHLDSDLTLLINGWNCPASDAVWQFFSSVKVWIPLYVLVVLFFFRNLGWKRALLATAACVLTFVCCDQISGLVKDAVQRLRPCWDLNMVNGGLNILEGKGGRYGFFSAHSANSMGFALCSAGCFRLDGKRGYKGYSVLIVLWSLMMGISRVFVGKHFLGDVLVGFAVGALAAWLFCSLAKSIAGRLNL